MSRRWLLVPAAMWLGFVVFLATRGIRQQGLLTYLDNGNVASLVSSNLAVLAAVAVGHWIADRRAARRHEQIRSDHEAWHTEHSARLARIESHLTDK